MWYLSQELVVMALCDPGTTVEDKEAIAEALVSSDRPQHFDPEPTVHQTEMLIGKAADEPHLAHFVGPRSWILFDILDVDVQFLSQHPTMWPGNPSYLSFARIIQSIECVNDAAERAVKDVVDYINYSDDVERNDDVILVVNSHHELVDFRNLTKEECAKLT
jgi:hypothetical protein